MAKKRKSEENSNLMTKREYLQQRQQSQRQASDGRLTKTEYLRQREEQQRQAQPGVFEQIGQGFQNYFEQNRRQQMLDQYTQEFTQAYRQNRQNQRMYGNQTVRTGAQQMIGSLAARKAEAEADRSPMEQYRNLPESEKAQWWSGNKGESVKSILSDKEARKYVDSHLPDIEGVQTQKKYWQGQLDKANATDRAEAERLAGITQEERKQAGQEAWNLKGQLGVYTQLDTQGLEIPANRELGNSSFTTRKRPEDYFDTYGNYSDRATYYDSILYDKIHGAGAYNDIYENGTDEEYDRMDAEVENLWNRLEKGTLHEIADQMPITQRTMQEKELTARGQSTEQLAAQSQARYAQEQLDSLNKLEKEYTGYYDYMGRYETPAEAGYNPENDRYNLSKEWNQQEAPLLRDGKDGKKYIDPVVRESFKQGNVHQIYSFINEGAVYSAWLNTVGDGEVSDDFRTSWMMNDTERRIFNDFYNNGKYDEASAFIDGLQPYLKSRYTEYETIKKTEAARQYKILASGQSLIDQASDVFVAPVRTVAGWLGDESVKDKTSDWYKATNEGQLYQNAVMESLPKPVQKTYGVVMNSLRNVINGLLTKGAGLAGWQQKAASLLSFGSQIYQESTFKYLDETGDYDKAQGLALLDAVMETAEEMLPYEAMLGDSTRPIMYFVKNALSEAGEEFTGATIGEKIKGLITGKDNVQQRADQIFNEGGYTDRNGNWVAIDTRDRQKALNQADYQALVEWGDEIKENTIAGAAGGGMGSVYAIGANVMNRFSTGRTVNAANNTEGGKTGAERIVELAKGMKEGTESRKQAEQISQQMEKGSKPGNYEIGKLAQTIMQETGEQQKQVISQIAEEDIRGQLENRGVEAEAAQKFAEIIRKSVTEGSLTLMERSALARDARAIDVWKTYNTMSKAAVELAKKIPEAVKEQTSIAEAVGELVSSRTVSGSAAAMEIERSIKETNSTAEAIDNLASRRSDLMSEEYAEEAKAVLEATGEKTTKNFLDDAMKIRMAAMTLNTMPQTKIGAEAAQRLFNKAQEEFNRIDEERVIDQKQVKPGEGTAEYDGAEYGTTEWADKVKDLTKRQRNQMGALGEIATRAGLNVRFINDTENTNIYGFEDNSGLITINVAGMNRGGMGHHMLVTMSHEMTHWLEQNSREGYNALRKYIVDGLRAKGENVEEMIVRTIDNQNAVLGAESGQSLTINGAMAELVAKSCENLLSSEAMMKAIQQENPSVYSKIKTFVKDFTARIRQAVEGMTGSLSREARTLLNETEKIADLWLGAREEALGRKEGGRQAEEGVSFSVQDAESERLYNELTAAREEEQKAREEFKGINEEYNDRISKYMENQLPEELEKLTKWADKNYMPLKNKLDSAVKKVQDINKEWNEYLENRDVTAEKAAIEKSGLSEADYRRKQAMKEFGSTSDFREAGYMLPNGSMLNFSGEKGRHYGSRGQDHRAIGTIYASNNMQGGKAMIAFMNDGNIRVMAETPGIDIIKEPTANQYAQIRAMARRFAGEEYFNVDFTNENGDVIDSIEYDGRVNAERITNDIKHFFRTGEVPQQSIVSQFHYSVAEMDDQYMKAVESGNAEKQQKIIDQAAKEAGYTIKAYHGTGRADRVGTVFLPERATSGPMAYFTDSREIAQNYAKDKKDTSIEYDDEYGDYNTQFRIKNKYGKEIPLIDLWDTLPYKEKQRITEAGKHITWDDEMDNIIYDEDAEQGNGGFNQWTLRDKHGNAISALMEAWLWGGDLFEQEERFLDVLKLAGINNVKWNNPDARYEKVYDTYLKITNPFDTSTMYTNEFVDGLLEWWDEQDQDKFIKESRGADFWDKNNVSVEEWADIARDDIKRNGTHNFTRIPDAVSAYIKSLGYDGIKDQGGKGGGEQHTVWIPFTSEQVKSAEPVTYDDAGNVIPLSERFNEEKPDIRYSISESPDMEVNNFMMGLQEFNLATEQEKTMLRQYKGLKGDIEIVKMAISENEKKRAELMAKGRLNAEDQEKVNAINQQIKDRKAEVEKEQRSLIDENNKLTQEKWAIQKEKRLTNAERDRLKEINKTIQQNNEKVAEIGYKLAQEVKKLTAQRAELQKGSTLSSYDRDQMIRANNRLVNDRNKLERLEREMVRVTSDEGYARLMYRQDSLMKNLVSGRTAGQLQQTVDAITREMDTVDRQMAERSEKLKRLAGSEAVLRIRQQFNRAGLKGIAAELKNEMQSGLENREIENRLALIALKMKQGEMDTDTVSELADLLAGRMKSDYDSYIISELRGRTISLSNSQMKELKAQDSSLREIQQELAGTGIRITAKGGTTLDQAWGQLCDLIPSLDRDASDKDMLNGLMDVIRSEKANVPAIFTDENMMAISESILKAAQKLIPEITTDAKSLNAIQETLKFVSAVSGEAKATAEAMEDIRKMIDRLKKTGEQAKAEAGTLTGDVGEMIEYFDTLSKQSEAAMWKRDRRALIDQLTSENTQNLLKEQEKWRQKIEKDKNAREMMAGNQKLRQRITTNVSRVRKLLVNETDLKNVPEHMKSLAREMISRIVENDLTGRKITGIDRKDLIETNRILKAMAEQDGGFTLDDLKMLNDEEAQALVADALADIEDGIGFYNNRPDNDLMANLKGYRNALEKISDAVSVITSVINAERNISFLDRTIPLADAAEDIRKEMAKSRFKGEWAGRGHGAISTAKQAVIYGNTTPVYFFKNLMNRAMDEQWKDMQAGENRSGLETQKAKDYLANVAAETNYRNWADQTHEVTLGGQKRTVTIENMMELYAIWKREQTSNPEMSQHLAQGGVFIREDSENEGFLRRENKQQRAFRVTDAEILQMYDQMTEEQKQYIERIVSYLSNEMSEIGNEASMRMYGIKKYKETYYFPMKVWDGVKSARSDKGITGTDENRAAHRSWSKRRQHMARNALVIGNFTQDAVNHIVEMINYNTMAPAIENMNKILNYQFTEGEDAETETKRNMRMLFQEAYGRDALNYLETFMKDLNGGVTQDQRKTMRDRLLTVFKKNAVAGSMSVALQQPLSYIRAAMMISPKYLVMGLNPATWKGSYTEMNKYSGVAVIKDMGRFDMNFGQSAKDYITPETGKNAYEAVSDVLTKAPELMDRMTWTRMWAAVKAEQQAKHPKADPKSEQFMQQVANRFNELMRRTQVYDSVMVKSSNMRSQKWEMKLLTSFMAEPTLSLNVLADAVRNVKQEGGKGTLAKAGATFLMSAVMQAAVKGLMGSGRSPDKKKTWLENFLNKLQYNLMNEANPFSLIPGYSDLVEVLKTGELKDDAMGALGKLFSIVQTSQKAINGKGYGVWRDLEDTVGQFVQMWTNIPLKNLSRDVRAMRNWIAGDTYANRPTSAAVLRQQAIAGLHTADNLMGTLNTWLGDAGFGTAAKDYVKRMYDAEKAGNKARAEEMKEYMMLGMGREEKTITQDIQSMTKADSSLSYSEKIRDLRKRGAEDSTIASWIAKLYKDGKIKKEEAVKLYREANPKKSEDDAYFYFEQAQYEKESGEDLTNTDYFRLQTALRDKDEKAYNSAVKELLDHGHNEKDVKEQTKSFFTKRYKEGEISRKEAEDGLKKYCKDMKEDDIWWTLDLIEWKKETGDSDASGKYYRLYAAMDENKTDSIRTAVNTMLKHGMEAKNIKKQIGSKYKDLYLAADSARRIKIRDAMEKAYKILGFTAKDADETINNWTKPKKKK